MASPNYQPATCKIIPHGSIDGGDSLHLRLAFAARGFARGQIDQNVYNEFWWDWPARLYAAWNGGRMLLTWQPYSAPLPAPTKGLVLNATSAIVTAPRAGRPGAPQPDNSLSWLTGPLTSASGAPSLTAAWRALISKDNATPRLKIFDHPVPGKPPVTPSMCTPNAFEAYNTITNAVALRAKLAGLTVQPQGAQRSAWFATTHTDTGCWLQEQIPYLIHRHDVRTDELLIPNLCGQDDANCNLRDQLKGLLYKAFAVGGDQAATAQRVERNLARLCQSGQPFRDLTCSALLTAFAPLQNNSVACPACSQPAADGAQPQTVAPSQKSVDWVNSAIYRGAAQTAATKKHADEIMSGAKSAREAWQQSVAVPASVPTDAGSIDIGQVAALANDSPLAELFGLALDIKVTRAAVEAALGPGMFATLLQQQSALRCGFILDGGGAPPIKFESYSPVTVSAAGAYPEEGNPTRPNFIRSGFLLLGDINQFTVTDFSYSTFHANYRLWFPTVASHLKRVGAAAGDLSTLSENGLPRRRRSTERRFRKALEDTPQVPEVSDGVVEVYYRGAGTKLTERMDKEAGQQQGSDDGGSINLYADDLARGYGLEVKVGDEWVSQTYATESRAVSVGGAWYPILDGTVELEGFVKWAPHKRIDAASEPATDPNNYTPPHDVHAPENLLTWPGFGLRVMPPGTIRDSQSTTPDARHRALLTSRGIPHQRRFTKLRYNTCPLLRIPIFDLTGARLDANPAVAYDSSVERQVPVSRHRRVKPPELLIVNPLRGEDSLGETLEQVIVRTGKQRNDDVSQRVLVPPRAAEDMAYLEGKFDPQSGGRRLKDSGSFKDVKLQKITTPQGPVSAGQGDTVTDAQYVTYQFPLTDVKKKQLPKNCPLYQDPDYIPTGAYWPDPRASQVYVTVWDLVNPQANPVRLVTPFYARTRWPDAHRIYFTVQRVNSASLAVNHGFHNGREEIQIRLPPAHQVSVDLQSLPDDAGFDGMNPPTILAAGLFMAHAAASLGVQQVLDAAAPAQTLTLIHAIDAPLAPPTVKDFQFRQIIHAYARQTRTPDKQTAVTETTVAFKGDVTLDYKSTGKVTVVAVWDELVLSAGTVQRQHFEAPLTVLDTNDTTQLGATTLSMVGAAESDTTLIPDWVLNDGSSLVTFNKAPPRARSVQIVARASVRDSFAKYFPNGKVADPLTGVALAAPWLNTQRPAAPRLKQAMHSFNRYSGDARPPRRVSGRSKENARTAAGFCIYVDELLQDAGEHGLLGVVLWQQPRAQAMQYTLSRRSNIFSSEQPSTFAGMNFSADYPVKVGNAPYPVPGAVRTLDSGYWDAPTRSTVTRWAADVFQGYPRVATPAPTLQNFVLQGDDPHERADPYTGARKPYTVKVFDYLSVGGLEPFEVDPTLNPPPSQLNDTHPESFPTYPFTVLGYEPQYDSRKGLYFYEIRFKDFAPETFLKLALVSLQPNSLRFAECSEVMFAPYIKPLGDRFTVVTPDWTGRQYQIDVYGGPLEGSVIATHGAFGVELYGKDRSGRTRNATAQGSNTRVTLDLLDISSRTDGCLWSAKLKITDDDLGELRLLVKESRRYAQPGSRWPQKDLGEVLVYWEHFSFRG